MAVLRTHFTCLPLSYFFSLLDKDLQLPSGFNCNFDFPEEPCGWMYDHAKWLRSTWTSSSTPDHQTFPGKPAMGEGMKELRLACPMFFSSRSPDELHNFTPQGSPLLFAHKPPESLLTTSSCRRADWWLPALSCADSTAWKLGRSERGQN